MSTTFEQLMDICPYCKKKLDPMLKMEEREYHRQAHCIRKATYEKLQKERNLQTKLAGF